MGDLDMKMIQSTVDQVRHLADDGELTKDDISEIDRVKGEVQKAIDAADEAGFTGLGQAHTALHDLTFATERINDGDTDAAASMLDGAARTIGYFQDDMKDGRPPLKLDPAGPPPAPVKADELRGKLAEAEQKYQQLAEQDDPSEADLRAMSQTMNEIGSLARDLEESTSWFGPGALDIPSFGAEGLLNSALLDFVHDKDSMRSNIDRGLDEIHDFQRQLDDHMKIYGAADPTK